MSKGIIKTPSAGGNRIDCEPGLFGIDNKLLCQRQNAVFQPCVITVILNTNRRSDTLACLASLQNNAYRKNKIIVLDNHSTDESVQSIQSAYPAVQIIELAANLGYAGNNNVGIKAAMDAGADWVFILNEDTILAPDCLAILVAAGESDPHIGIVGPMVYHSDEPDVIQSAGGMLGPYWQSLHLAKNERDVGQFSQPHRVDWISGCAILVRRAVIEQVGMIDPRFFIYWEETEWCVRASNAGWSIMHVPEAHLWHKGVQRDYRPRPHVTYYSTRNRFLMLCIHHAPLRAWINAWIESVQTIASWTLKPKWRIMREHRDASFRGILDFLRRRWGPMIINEAAQGASRK